jgi:hypothetical protein
MEKLPSENHEEKFLAKLQSRAKKFINLTPYFIKLAIITIIMFLCSIFAWYSLLRIDNNKSVIENIIEQFKPQK